MTEKIAVMLICLQDENDRNAIIKRCAPKTKIYVKKIQNMSQRGIAGFITRVLNRFLSRR